jgi:hypothetical protein
VAQKVNDKKVFKMKVRKSREGLGEGKLGWKSDPNIGPAVYWQRDFFYPFKFISCFLLELA